MSFVVSRNSQNACLLLLNMQIEFKQNHFVCYHPLIKNDRKIILVEIKSLNFQIPIIRFAQNYFLS